MLVLILILWDHATLAGVFILGVGGSDAAFLFLEWFYSIPGRQNGCCVAHPYFLVVWLVS